MSLNSTDLQAFMTAHGIAGEIMHMNVPTPTVEIAAQALGVRVDQIVKSILFLVRGQPVLAITCGTAYIDRRAIATYYGMGHKRIKLASPEEVRSISGYEVGAMPPFGHRQPLPTLLDRHVLDLPEVYAGGGEENAMLRLNPQEIPNATTAVIMDLTST
jgi:prolyl-tRNA editing enzyme YbaK/EbsC (Cys-tRNA(Pro) deacylase)